MNPIQGKQIYFLGSSVTYGSGAHGVSFVELLRDSCGCRCIKEAVSGTTLVDNGPDSYIARMKSGRAGERPDLFVCQLSTNDATRNEPLGEISQSRKQSDFDTRTVTGALEYIIAWASEVYQCPVMFYTNPRYDSLSYGAMVSRLLELQKKWGFLIIDLWNDESFNSLTSRERAAYLRDPIHPTIHGYDQWWLPVFAREIARAIG